MPELAGNVTITAPASTPTANCTFSLDSDDGSQLYVDGALVIDKKGTNLPWTSYVGVSVQQMARWSSLCCIPGESW